MNLAFAIELLLKALLYCEGKKVRGHKMNELFACLPSQTQLEVKQAFKERHIKTTGRGDDMWGLTFEDRLQQYADTYNYWRYLHEKRRGNFNSQFCENLAEILNEMAWQNYKAFLIRVQESVSRERRKRKLYN